MLETWSELLKDSAVAWGVQVATLEGIVAVVVAVLWIFARPVLRRLELGVTKRLDALSWKWPATGLAVWFIWVFMTTVSDRIITEGERNLVGN